jgi:UDP-glucuronate 4-epimerase
VILFITLHRNFTYIDDKVEGIERLLPNPPMVGEKATKQMYNIGNNCLERLMVFIETLKNVSVIY